MTGISEIGQKPQTGTGYHAVHILTPESDRTTHYFFTAVRYNVKTTDEKLNRKSRTRSARCAASPSRSRTSR